MDPEGEEDARRVRVAELGGHDQKARDAETSPCHAARLTECAVPGGSGSRLTRTLPTRQERATTDSSVRIPW